MVLGKCIDRAALLALGTTGYYLFLLNAWHSIPVACVGAFACVILTDRIIRALPLKRRANRGRIRAELHRLSSLDEEEAAAVMDNWIKARWPGEAFRLSPVLKHPEATLTCGDVLSAWKANRDAEHLVLAGTCPCEPRAAAYARTLRAPSVAVVDSRALTRLMRKRGDALPPLPHLSFKDRIKRAAMSFSAYRATPRDAMLCTALFGLYMMTGNPICLFCALALVGRMCVAVNQRRLGIRLFDV